MIYIVQNLPQILAATAAGLILGAVYHRFGAWRSRAPSANRPELIAIAAVAEFWLCCILAGALILAPPEAPRWIMAIGSALVIWIGFVLPTLMTTFAYRRISLATGAADAGHWLAVMLLQAVVLEAIGLTPPPT